MRGEQEETWSPFFGVSGVAATRCGCKEQQHSNSRERKAQTSPPSYLRKPKPLRLLRSYVHGCLTVDPPELRTLLEGFTHLLVESDGSRVQDWIGWHEKRGSGMLPTRTVGCLLHPSGRGPQCSTRHDRVAEKGGRDETSKQPLQCWCCVGVVEESSSV